MGIQNIEAEQTVLGALLLDGELIKECRLTEQHFSVAVHQAIFKLIKKIEADGQPLDLVTLVSKMDAAFLEQIGGVAYMANLVESVPNTANFSYYEGLVRGAWKMHQAGIVAQSMSEQLLAERDEKVIGETITALCELEEADCTLDFNMKDALVRLYEEFHQDRGDITGIETGFSALDKMTCGLQEGDFGVIGARPSMGKTAFALNIAFHAAKSGAAVGMFSLEMSEPQLLTRLVSCAGKVSGGRMKNPKGRFTLEDWGKASEAFGEISDLPLEIYDQAGVTMQGIWTQVRKLKRKHPGKKLLIIIDYLQLITGDTRHKENRYQEMSEISRKLKILARDLNVCVVALSQLSRAVESRNDKRPLLSDLRETGQIEQDADVIMLMYREDYYDKDTEDKDVTEIHVAKHRNGPVGVVKLQFLKEYGRFVEGRG
ncbi:replicative DNA helicase [Microbacteriaceae bacterium 4G12]